MTPSSPPLMWPRELVGDTQASTFWSSIDPRTISTSGFSSKLVRHESIIFVLISTRMILTDIGFLPCSPHPNPPPQRGEGDLAPSPAKGGGLGWGGEASQALVALELDQILLPLLLRRVDHIFVIVELRVDIIVAADAVAAVEAIGRLR